MVNQDTCPCDPRRTHRGRGDFHNGLQKSKIIEYEDNFVTDRLAFPTKSLEI